MLKLFSFTYTIFAGTSAVPAKIVYVKDNSKCFKINEIDFNKIRVFKKGFTAKNIIHTNIMGFISMIMNTSR